jgi:hypothetical protein
MDDATCSGLVQCIATSCAGNPDPDACVNQFCPGCATQGSITLFNAIGACAETACPVCAEP